MPTVANVGRQTTEQRLYLEGENNLLDASLDLEVWSQGGTVFGPASAIEVHVDDQGTWARGAGQAWEPVDGFSELFAPTGDLLAFTVAARDVKQMTGDQGFDLPYTRYSYQIDGPRYAAFIRDQMQVQLTAKGELPPGVTLDLPASYRDMGGTGELWVDAEGLPESTRRW